MASIRTIKKDVNAITFDLLEKCYALKHKHAEISDDDFEEVLRKIVLLRNDLILRTNHPEADAESKDLRSHYRKVQQDLYELIGVYEELKKKIN